MKTINTSPETKASQLLFALTSRITVGGAVCFTEGLATSIFMAVPRGQTLHIVATLIGLGAWLAFWRFRDSKLGADIGDLYFLDFCLQGLALALYLGGVDPTLLWYPIVTIFALKIIRVYISQNAATQKYGWGQYGPMTRFYAKHYSANGNGGKTPRGRLELEIFGSIVVAFGASIAIHYLSDVQRVFITWFVPYTFDFLYGPMQLRNLKIFGGLLSTKDEQITELTAKLALSEAKNELLREMGNLPDEECVALINAYRVLPKEKQIGLVQWARLMAKNFGLPTSDSNTK